MIIGVTGHVASGKTSFVLRYATSFGREGLFIMVGQASTLPEGAMENERGFTWRKVQADVLLPNVLDVVNRESNVFRADRRVIVIDDAAEYFMAAHHELAMDTSITDDEYEAAMIAKREMLEQAITAYQGKLFIVSSEPGSVTPFMGARERSYHIQLAQFNRMLSRRAHQWFRMSAGIPHELRSTKYRL